MLRKVAGLLTAVVLISVGLMSATARNMDANHQSTWTEEEFDKLFKANNNWGRWGKDDQLGAINLITDAKRKQAASLVKAGISVSIAHPLMTENAPDNSDSFKHVMGSNRHIDTYTLKYHGVAVTHLDALCHFYYKGLLYNGVPETSSTDSGCSKLGVEVLRNGIVTRGILIDIPRLRGVPYLEGGVRIYQEEVESWLKKIGVKPTPGDAIILRTGRWARRAKLGPWNPGRNSAGFDVSMLPWFKTHDIAMVAADILSEAETTPSYMEGTPQPPPDFHGTPLHAGLITGLGIPIIDALDTEELSETAARLNRWEFMLVIAPLVAPGGTGSPVNPVAIF